MGNSFNGVIFCSYTKNGECRNENLRYHTSRIIHERSTIFLFRKRMAAFFSYVRRLASYSLGCARAQHRVLSARSLFVFARHYKQDPISCCTEIVKSRY